MVYCPLEGVLIANSVGPINDPVITLLEDACCDCGNCLRWADCKTGALQQSKNVDSFPRQVRRLFSDPVFVHSSTGVPGRGTEECKTNDVTDRVQPGQVGVLLEFGRPGVGTRLATVEQLLKALASKGFTVIEDNPVRELLANINTGELLPGLAEQVVLSIIVEYVVTLEQTELFLAEIRRLKHQLEGVFSLSVMFRDTSRQWELLETVLKTHGFGMQSSSKVNFGLGRQDTRA